MLGRTQTRKMEVARGELSGGKTYYFALGATRPLWADTEQGPRRQEPSMCSGIVPGRTGLPFWGWLSEFTL